MRHNLKLISSDVNTRQMTLQDTSVGYTSPALCILLVIDNAFGTNKDGVVRYQNTFDPTHPEYLVIPKAVDIGNGTTFTVDSYKLGITESTQGYLSYREGVLNLNYYVGLEVVTASGTKGESWLVGTGFDPIIENYDSVIIGKEVYQILKDRPSNAGTVMYLDKSLSQDVTEVTVAERSNLKIRNNFQTKKAIAKVACILTDSNYFRPSVSEKSNRVMKLIVNDTASKILFENEDYIGSEKLLNENILIIQSLGIWQF